MNTILPPTPEPNSPLSIPAKRSKVIFWKWTLLVSGVFVAYLMWQCGSGLYQGAKQSKAAVHHFHEQLNNGEFEKIVEEADPAVSKSGHDEFIEFLRAVHTKLGDATSESMGSVHVNATTGGTFVVVSFNSTFTGGAAQETFTWVKRMSGLKLYRYHVESKAFLK
ncbi:MAG TPA: hypothetical protein VEG64_07120 [Candidatus Sulfotelmatobacter sp.]|nr:hypothetical protein [Candidatus Sulfotelmatobacter sp.]